jgi:hypothetical protein
VLQYSTIDSTADRFINEASPTASAISARPACRPASVTRGSRRSPGRGILADVTASFYPALWDVESAFGDVAANASAYLTFPVPLHPILLVRGGARKVFGDYPFNEAAFIGGMTTVRTLVLQRYAGDASLNGTAELRIPVARFPLVVPVSIGIGLVFGVLPARRAARCRAVRLFRRGPGIPRGGIARRMAHRHRRGLLGWRAGSLYRHQCGLDEYFRGDGGTYKGRCRFLAWRTPIN